MNGVERRGISDDTGEEGMIWRMTLKQFGDAGFQIARATGGHHTGNLVQTQQGP